MNEVGALVTEDGEKAEILIFFFTSVFTSKIVLIKIRDVKER